MQSQDQKPKILDQVCDTMCLRHYSIHTERTCLDWIKRYIDFQRMKSRDDLADGESKIEAFLTHLAVEAHVASATPNQAMNALVFLYKHVLTQPRDQPIKAIRVLRKLNIPGVLSPLDDLGVENQTSKLT